jgi:hypothetical protein
MNELGTAGKLVTDPASQGRVDRITGRLVAQAVMVAPQPRNGSGASRSSTIR